MRTLTARIELEPGFVGNEHVLRARLLLAMALNACVLRECAWRARVALDKRAIVPDTQTSTGSWCCPPVLA